MGEGGGERRSERGRQRADRPFGNSFRKIGPSSSPLIGTIKLLIGTIKIQRAPGRQRADRPRPEGLLVRARDAAGEGRGRRVSLAAKCGLKRVEPS